MLLKMLWIGISTYRLYGLSEAPTTASLSQCYSVRYRMTVYVEQGYVGREPCGLTAANTLKDHMYDPC